MTICPIAIAVGCQKCPVLRICPLKSVLGDTPKSTTTHPLAMPPGKGSMPFRVELDITGIDGLAGWISARRGPAGCWEGV